MHGSSSAKNDHERKFPVIREKSLQLICESAGFEVAENTCAVLAGDLNYRLRDLIHTSSLLLKCSKRRKLSVEDINRSLHHRLHPTFPGYSSKETAQFLPVDPAGVFVAEDKEVNLNDLAFDDTPFYYHGGSYVTTSWLMINGNLTKEGQASPTKSLSGAKEVESKPEDDPIRAYPYYPQEVLELYRSIVIAVFKTDLDNSEHLKGYLKLLCDVRKREIIGSLTVPLARFAQDVLEKYRSNFSRIFKLLMLLEVLALNPHVNFHAHECDDALVSCLVDFLFNSPLPPESVEAIATRNKSLTILELLTHGCASGANIHELVVRSYLTEYIDVPVISHRLLARAFNIYSLFSPGVILYDVFPTALDQLDLMLSLVANITTATPEVTYAFMDAIGAFKICLYSIYKHVLSDALDELFTGSKSLFFTLDKQNYIISPCAVLNAFIPVFIDLFGDTVLHLLLPLILPDEARRVKIAPIQPNPAEMFGRTSPESNEEVDDFTRPKFRYYRDVESFRVWRSKKRQEVFEPWFEDAGFTRLSHIEFKFLGAMPVPPERLKCGRNRLKVFWRYEDCPNRMAMAAEIGKAPRTGVKDRSKRAPFCGLYYAL